MGALWGTSKFKNTLKRCREHKTINSYLEHSSSEQAFYSFPYNTEFEEIIKKHKKDKP